MSERVIRILLAEDDENDVRITRRAFKKGGLAATVLVARDGEAALDVLLRRDDHADTPCPDLVLLDINLPRLNGIEVLREIRATERLRRVPVLILTTSARPHDVAAAYAHGANAFMCKPMRFTDFVQALTRLTRYWCEVARLPSPVEEPDGDTPAS